MSRWSSQEDRELRELVRKNIVNYSNLEPNYLFEVTQEHFPSFIGTGPAAQSTAIQRLLKKFRRLAKEFTINRGRLLSGESCLSFVHAVLQQTSHVFCFSDEDINEDKEDGDEEGWERVDVDDNDDKEIMPKKDASPSPCTPGMTATTASKKTPPQSVASLEKDMKTMLVAAGPSKFVHFNFNHRYILCATATT
jgi:hypothetical protein